MTKKDAIGWARHYLYEARRLVDIAETAPSQETEIHINVAMILIVKAASTIEPYTEKEPEE